MRVNTFALPLRLVVGGVQKQAPLLRFAGHRPLFPPGKPSPSKGFSATPL
jgi:hypothetical protein